MLPGNSGTMWSSMRETTESHQHNMYPKTNNHPFGEPIYLWKLSTNPPPTKNLHNHTNSIQTPYHLHRQQHSQHGLQWVYLPTTVALGNETFSFGVYTVATDSCTQIPTTVAIGLVYFMEQCGTSKVRTNTHKLKPQNVGQVWCLLCLFFRAIPITE